MSNRPSMFKLNRDRLRKTLARMANAVLRPLGAQLVPYTGKAKPWDEFFLRWIAEATASGQDPNDIGDLEWNDDPLKEVLERHYLPWIHPDSVVLELGPGTGRLTRHILGRCREVILVDYSELVCDWLHHYLKGKGNYRIIHIDRPVLARVKRDSVDVIVANGVFEHIDIDDLVCFLESFHRVLKPGGVVAFNFDNLMSPEGVAWFKRFRAEPGAKCIFRFHHPDVVRKLAEEVGFQILQLHTSASRFAYIAMRKPA